MDSAATRYNPAATRVNWVMPLRIVQKTEISKPDERLLNSQKRLGCVEVVDMCYISKNPMSLRTEGIILRRVYSFRFIVYLMHTSKIISKTGAAMTIR